MKTLNYIFRATYIIVHNKQKMNINNKNKKNIVLFSENKKEMWYNDVSYVNSLPSYKQWRNSVYFFNNNKLANIPQYDKLVISLSNSFYNMYVLNIEKKITKKKYYLLRKRFRRLSFKRIIVSKPEIKHSSDMVLLTFYTYNKQKTFLLNKIKQLQSIHKFKENNQRIILIRKLISLSLYKSSFIKLSLKRYYNTTKSILKLNTYKKFLVLFDNIIYSKKKSNLICLEKCLLKLLEKEILNNYYKLLLYINKSKFNELYLSRLGVLFTNIYNKKVEFNIINLKYLYLSSDIMSQAVKLKLKNRRNRVLKVLRILINKVKLPKIKNYENNNINLLKDKRYVTPNTKNINTSILINNGVDNTSNVVDEKKQFISLTSYKVVTGVRIEASGRLTKRLTASRAINKFKYKGSLKNIKSSYNGLSSEMLRNQLKSNVDYTQLNSKTRNGAFGLKGWVAHI